DLVAPDGRAGREVIGRGRARRRDVASAAGVAGVGGHAGVGRRPGRARGQAAGGGRDRIGPDVTGRDVTGRGHDTPRRAVDGLVDGRAGGAGVVVDHAPRW